MKSNKQGGIIGSTIVLFVATVAIIIILLVFIFAAGVIKVFDGVNRGVKIHNEFDTGLGNVSSYSENLVEFEKIKVDFASGGNNG